jgi:hypothetical protein
MLATGTLAVEPNDAAGRYGIALACGVFGSALLMAALLGARPDLGQALLLPMFWVKFAYVGCLALTSAILAFRLSRPGGRVGGVPSALAVTVIAMWMLAAFVLTSADPLERRQLLFGGTSTTCPFFIAMLAVPVFLAAIWAMKGLAPTRLRLAGAAAGLLSGSLGAVVYSVHCPEMAPPFLGVWYLLGVLIPTGVGALVGPRLLRW